MNVSERLVQRERETKRCNRYRRLRTIAAPNVLARYFSHLSVEYISNGKSIGKILLEDYMKCVLQPAKSLHFYRKSQHQGQRKIESEMNKYLLYIVIKSDFQVNTNIDFQFALFHRHTSLSFTHSFSRCHCSWTRTHSANEEKRRKRTHSTWTGLFKRTAVFRSVFARRAVFSCTWAAPHTKSEFTIKPNKFK